MHFVIVRFTIEKVDSNGNDIALVRLPRLAITINEDSEENVLPVCVPWTGNELVFFFIRVRSGQVRLSCIRSGQVMLG